MLVAASLARAQEPTLQGVWSKNVTGKCKNGKAGLACSGRATVSILNTASTMYFRIVDDSATVGGSISGGNIGTAGTDRIDNFTEE